MVKASRATEAQTKDLKVIGRGQALKHRGLKPGLCLVNITLAACSEILTCLLTGLAGQHSEHLFLPTVGERTQNDSVSVDPDFSSPNVQC